MGRLILSGRHALEAFAPSLRQFQTVEIDSTFYGTPAASTVTSWNEKTPGDFIFAVKLPQVITHEKVLVDCEPELDEFIERMHLSIGRQTRAGAFAIPQIRQVGAQKS